MISGNLFLPKYSIYSINVTSNCGDLYFPTVSAEKESKERLIKGLILLGEFKFCNSNSSNNMILA